MEPITKYLQAIKALVARGNATEHSFRPAIINLIEASAKGVKATNEPKRVKAGAPDLIVTKGQIPLGYIETKDIGKSLDEIENSEQMSRYLKGLNNLILTDYLEFRWYEGGEKRLAVRIANVFRGKIQIEKDAAETLAQLFKQFFTTEIPSAESPKELASKMAALGQLIRDVILKALGDEDKSGSLHGQLDGFRKVLLHDLEESQFADMYAQTICYGLFAAKCNHQGPKPFTRESAALELPETNPFLAEMFDYIAGRRLDKSLVWIVDHLAELLRRADTDSILRDFGKRTRREDPVVHFYETFLAAYDPKMREARGVYYTPEPVVSYIVRSIDHILKTDFGLPDGLADTSKVPAYKNVEGKDGKTKRVRDGECHKVLILDPAVGTGTFLYGVIDQIHDHVMSHGGKGMWSGYVSKHLLPRLFGFELLMAPYAVAHMKLGLQLKESGYKFNSGERLKIYLTNTLEESQQLPDLGWFANKIAEEANAASSVKTEAPVMVILGNPPYSYESENTGIWISNLIRDYFQFDGKPLGERNPKGLQDDYVKFIRFAQWRIEQTGYGVLAFICNHGYLDNPTFRGMRQSLMATFDDIYVLDLHGNSKRKEQCPDGSRDENVFDIQQGVAIGIFIKRKEQPRKKCLVKHADLWGLRQVLSIEGDVPSLIGGKYYWLLNNDISSTKWSKVSSSEQFNLFVTRSKDVFSEYQSFFPLSKIFNLNSVGVATSRDSLTIQFNPDEVLSTVKNFINMDVEEARIKYDLSDDTVEWRVSLAQEDLKRNKIRESLVKKILYRPFDFRFTYYTGRTRGFISRTRFKLMRHMLEKNKALYIGRQGQAVGSDIWDLVLCGNLIEDYNLYRRGNNACFPLYLYPGPNVEDMISFETIISTFNERQPNFTPNFIKTFENTLKLSFVTNRETKKLTTLGPEDIFHYMYAIFHSPAYRKRYAEFLKIDFPRLPLTSNKELFRSLCNLGEELVGLHLMEKHGPPITQYPINGDNKVEKVRYTEPGQGAPCGRVWINKEQYFENVPPDIWQFHIGGYQVCEKWLKDRKGRTLSYDDLTHYQYIVSALSETIRLMNEIDQCIDKNGGWPIK